MASTTITDVARAAGVSIATVSRVLSPGPVPHPVRAETADRVRAAARQLNFIPSPLARGLAARRSGLIGLIVPDLSDPHYPQIAIAVEDRARDAELAVLICNTLGEIERMAEYLQRNFVVTTSGVEDPLALDYTIRKLGIDNVLWAIDYPYQPQKPAHAGSEITHDQNFVGPGATVLLKCFCVDDSYDPCRRNPNGP